MKKLFLTLIAIIAIFSTTVSPVMAAKNADKNKKGVETAILTGCGSSDDGVVCILNLVVDIMTIGVGILGVIGITIVGIQYLTAGGDESKTRKAKRRMFEIVIGLASYVVIYALLKWLLPGFGT